VTDVRVGVVDVYVIRFRAKRARVLALRRGRRANTRSPGSWETVHGTIEPGERPPDAARREVREETGLDHVRLRAPIHTIDWYFRFRGRLIHKVCHFFLMEAEETTTRPQADEGITACRWERFDDAVTLVSYENARDVLRRAHGQAPRRSATA